MAYVQSAVDGDGGDYDFMLISDSVGANAANWWTDIQLVQYLIGNVYDYAAKGAGNWQVKLSESELGAFPDPNKDYKALRRTAALIKRFQEDCVKQGIAVYPDGRVDRARTAKSSITKSPYTILVANMYFESAIWYGEQSDDPVEWALNDWFMPDMLKGQLRKSMENELGTWILS